MRNEGALNFMRSYRSHEHFVDNNNINIGETYFMQKKGRVKNYYYYYNSYKDAMIIIMTFSLSY